MRIFKGLTIAMAMAGVAVASPASAAIFQYDMTNGDVLTINSDTQSATWVGDAINATMTSPDFGGFTGGATPSFNYILSSLDGTRIIGGVTYTDNPLNIDTTHPQRLKTTTNGSINLWAWWGDPIRGGDYVRQIGSYTTPVPEPGALALFGLGLAGIGFARIRRRRKTA